MHLWINATETNSCSETDWMSLKSNISKCVCHWHKSLGQRLSACRRLQTMPSCIRGRGADHMPCPEGGTSPQSSIIKPESSPAALKATFVPFWKPSSGGYFVWKHHSRPGLRFLWKTTGGSTACVSVSPHIYWFTARQFATPSMCVSGVKENTSVHWEQGTVVKKKRHRHPSLVGIVHCLLSFNSPFGCTTCCSQSQQRTDNCQHF